LISIDPSEIIYEVVVNETVNSTFFLPFISFYGTPKTLS